MYFIAAVSIVVPVILCGFGGYANGDCGGPFYNNPTVNALIRKHLLILLPKLGQLCTVLQQHNYNVRIHVHAPFAILIKYELCDYL